MIAGSIFAIAQNNLKRMLAYSSIANVGYIVLAVGLAPSTTLGLSPAVMHIANHAVIKGCMFMTACGFIYKFNLIDIRNFTGLGRRMPYTSLALILASLAMIGMPPGSGFVTKWFLIRAALEARGYVFVGVIFVSTLLMIVYFWRVIEIMYIRHDKASPIEQDVVGIEELPASMLYPGLLLGAMSFILGLLWISGVLNPVLTAINSDFGLGGGP
jgi:multicomponent Na+:H+ antiporter subunit D